MNVKKSWRYAKRAAVGIFAAAAIFFLLAAAETVKAAEKTEDAAVWKEDAAGMSEDIAAQKMEESIDSYMQELDFSDIDKILSQQAGTEGLDFKELVQRLLDGEEIDKGWLAEEIFSAVFSEVQEFRGTLIRIVILCIVFAILYNFANVFENPSVTEISFYMVYVVLLVLLMNSFFVLRDVSVAAISKVVMFLKVMIPTFTASMVFSGQITTAAGFYDLTFLLIYGMEWVMQYLVIPGVQIYVALELMNHLKKCSPG